MNSKWILLIHRFYGWLLRFYPPSLRNQYGQQLLLMYEERCQDMGGDWRPARLLYWILKDFFRTSIQEYLLSETAPVFRLWTRFGAVIFILFGGYLAISRVAKIIYGVYRGQGREANLWRMFTLSTVYLDILIYFLLAIAILGLAVFFIRSGSWFTAVLLLPVFYGIFIHIHALIGMSFEWRLLPFANSWTLVISIGILLTGLRAYYKNFVGKQIFVALCMVGLTTLMVDVVLIYTIWTIWFNVIEIIFISTGWVILGLNFHRIHSSIDPQLLRGR